MSSSSQQAGGEDATATDRDGPSGRLYIAASLCYALANMDGKNKLYFGDNLKILRDYIEDASVDLIYLDPACPPRRACARLPSGRAGRPPFNSSASYNFSVALPFRAAHAGLKPGATAAGEESAAQITAIGDIRQPTDSGAWNLPAAGRSEAVYREIVECGPRKLADLMQAKANAAYREKGES